MLESLDQLLGFFFSDVPSTIVFLSRWKDEGVGRKVSAVPVSENSTG